MLRLLTDENFHGDIIRGLRLRLPDIDLVRAVDVGLGSTHDRVILDWAAYEGRVLLTHDVDTMPGFAYERIRADSPMSGMIVVPMWCPIGRAIDDILAFVGISDAEEWLNRVEFVPF